MSVTTPRNGLRARLRRLTHGAVVFAIALGAVGIGSGQAIAATEEEEPDAVVGLMLAAGQNGVVAPGVPFSATVTVQNGTADELSAGYVAVELNRTPLTDGAAVSSWLDDGEAAGDFQLLDSEPTEPVDADGTGTTSVFIPADAVGALAPGIYPLRASLAGASTGQDAPVSQPASATTVLVVTAAAAAPVAVLVPITATPAGGGLLTAEELTVLTAADGALTAQLDGVSGTGAILAIDPAVVAAIRVLGASAPTEATDWLTRLESLPNERFALQFADADPTTQARADLPSLLGPTTLAPFLDPANFPSAPPTATPSTTPSPVETAAPELPDEEELVAVPGAEAALLWPRADTSVDDLAAFTDYLGAGTTTILPASSADGGVGARATTDGHDLLLTDPAVSAALSQAAAESDPVARERRLAAASAQLFLAASAAPGAPLLVGLDRDETRDADALRAAVTAVSSPATGLAELRAAPAATVTLTTETDDSRGTALRTLLDGEEELNAFASILADPQLMLSPQRIRMLRVISVGVPSDEFGSVLAEHRRSTDALLGSVGITRPSVIRLFGTVADLPVWVRNDLPWPVSVRLSADPSDLKLDVDPVTEVEVLPASNTRVKVPIVARVGSGEVNVALSLYSPTGIPIGDDQVAQVVVRAEWEQIGLIVFGSLAALLIAGGVFRTVRRRRRDREATVADATDDDPGAPAPEKEPHE